MSVCRHKGKRQDADPKRTGDHSRTLKQGTNVLSLWGPENQENNQGGDLGTEVYVRLSICQNESQDVGKQESSQGDKSKLTLLDDSSLNSPSLKSELLLEPGQSWGCRRGSQADSILGGEVHQVWVPGKAWWDTKDASSAPALSDSLTSCSWVQEGWGVSWLGLWKVAASGQE